MSVLGKTLAAIEIAIINPIKPMHVSDSGLLAQSYLLEKA
jgi:hypothetical protein